MPEDRTILEGSTPEGKGDPGGVGADDKKILEDPGGSTDEATIIEGTQARAEASLNLVAGGKFLEYTLQEPLKTKGAEADLWFIADKEGQKHVLKLYRYGIKPKEEITEKIKALGFEHVVTVEESGEVSGRSYEILEKIKQRRSQTHELYGLEVVTIDSFQGREKTMLHCGSFEFADA